MAEEPLSPLDQLRDAAWKRLNSPFYFSLIVAFVATNWKAIYYLLYPVGDLDVTGRMSLLNDLYDDSVWYIMKVFVVPLVFACLYVTYIPRYLFKLDAFRRKDEVKQLNALKEIEKDLAETQRIIAQLKQESQAHLDAANRELSERRRIEQELKGVTHNFADSLNERNRMQAEYREIIANVILANHALRNTLVAIRGGSNPTSPVEALQDLTLVFKVITPDKKGLYTLTEEGKEIAKFIA